MENWYGIDMSKPLSQLKEYVAILRALFPSVANPWNPILGTASFGSGVEVTSRWAGLASSACRPS